MEKQSRQPGLYSPSFEHDNCGIGAVVSIKGIKTHQTVSDALSIVENLEHRAGKDAEGKTGDGVGILLQISHKFFKKAVKPLGIQIGVGEYVSASVLNAVETIHRTGTRTNSAIIIRNTYRNVPFKIFLFSLVIFQHHPIELTDQVTNYKYNDSPGCSFSKSKIVERCTINVQTDQIGCCTRSATGHCVNQCILFEPPYTIQDQGCCHNRFQSWNSYMQELLPFVCAINFSSLI